MKPSPLVETATPTPTLPATRTCRLPLDERALRAVLLTWFERSEGLLSVKELGSGRYVHVNARMAALLGRPQAEIIGLADVDLMESDQWAPLRAADQSAAALGTPQVSEHRLERAGQRREFSCVPAGAAGRRWRCTALSVQPLDRTSRRAGQGMPSCSVRCSRSRASSGPPRPCAARRRRAACVTPRRASISGSTSTTSCAAKSTFRRASTASSRWCRSRSTRCRRRRVALGAAARTRVLEALGRLLRSNTRAMDASCRLDEDRFAVLLSGVGLATAHSRMEGPASPVRDPDRDAGRPRTRLHRVDGRGQLPAHGAAARTSCCRPAEAALDQARRRGGNHVTLASIRFEPA